MKVRDSGMPERDYWETLFDIERILEGLAVDGRIKDAVELGCGYGTFTVPIARRIGGTLRAFDIEPAMVAATRARLAAERVSNVELHLRDVIAHGYGLAPGSADALFLFNILHAENPALLLRGGASLLGAGGRVLVIHWRSDVPTPRGPELSIRPRPEQVISWAAEAGLVAEEGPLILPPWHFGITFRRANV
jgi:SAM-dependent methyltransferase